MKYKIGFKIKPLKVSDGHVVFTDGTNEIPASQKSCEAYGYTWDASNSSCVISTYGSGTIAINKKITEASNTIGGNKNKLGGYVENSAVYGSDNKFEGNNRNILVNGNNNLVKGGAFNSAIISGNNNTLNNDVNNSTILSGIGAISCRDGETVIGGYNHEGVNDHFANTGFTVQSSAFVMQAITSDSSTAYYLNLNNTDFIPVHANSRILIESSWVCSEPSLTGVSSSRKRCHVAVDSVGTPSIIQQGTYDDNINGSSSIANPSGYFLIDGGKLKLKAIGFNNKSVVYAVSLTMTEVIYATDPDIF